MEINNKDYIGHLVNKTVSAGRPINFINHEAIFNDITHKLFLKQSNKLLDIGCGYGHLTDLFIEFFDTNQIESTFIDNENIINKLKQENHNKQNINFICGLFGIDNFESLGKYDRILCYSVLHYTNQPELFIDKAIEYLDSYGIAMFGDLPNLSQKARFITSVKGRIFDKEYKEKNNISFVDYPDINSFINDSTSEQKLIDDSFFVNIFRKYTNLDYDVYILPQYSADLPFNNTRVDLIIKKYD